MGIKERLQNEVAEGSKVSLSLRQGANILGRLDWYTEEGVFFDGCIPYSQIEDYTVSEENLSVTADDSDEAQEESTRPKKGETIAIRRKDSTFLTGRYVSEDITTIRIEIDKKGIVEEKKANCDHLYLCGVITSYNILNKSGVVNNKYKFNKSIVDTSSSIFKRLDKDDPREKNMYMCLYELKPDSENNLSIASLDDFDDIKDQIGWQDGEISAVSGTYFTVDDETRCYYSSVNDEALLRYHKNKDLQKQRVIYKKVYHRIGDEKRNPDILPTSIIDIKSKYQIGKTQRNRLTNAIKIQCGKERYRYLGEDVPEDISVVAELVVNDDRQGCTAHIISRDETKIPTFKKDLENQKHDLEIERERAEKRGDYNEQFDRTKKLLKENLWEPEHALDDMLKASLKAKQMQGDEDALEKMESVLQEYGYLLTANLQSVFRMQMAYLQGESEDAQKEAKRILQSSGQYKAEVLLQAKSVISGVVQFPIEELEAWIVHSGQNELVGTIDAFDANTDTGRISVDKEQYVFYWKDIESTQIKGEFDLSDKKFDFKKNRYIVSFRKVDSDVPGEGLPIKAVSIKICDVCPLRMSMASEAYWGDDFDAELDTIVNLPRNELLEYKLDQFKLEEIKEYLSLPEQEKIRDGIYLGITTSKVNIINAMDTLHDNEDNIKLDCNYFSKPIPRGRKSQLLLAQAKIISQYLQSDDFKEIGKVKEELNEVKKNRCLYEYAYDYVNEYYTLKDEESRPAGTMAYYASSIFSAHTFKKDKVKRAVDMCIARYYRRGWTPDWDNNGKNAKEFSEYLYKKCENVNGLINMVLSFPEDIFDQLLKLPQYDGMIKTLWEGTSKIKEISGDTPKKQVQRFYDAWNNTKKSFTKQLSITGAVKRDAKGFLDWLKQSGDGFVEYLFDEEQSLIEDLKEYLHDFMQYTDDESPFRQQNKIPGIYKSCSKLLDKIKGKPTKFSYEELRPFIRAMCENMAEYLEKLYRDNEPIITVEHCSLMETRTKEVLCLTNAAGALTANKIHVEISSGEGNSGFVIDKNKKISPDDDFKADPGDVIEVIVPIESIEKGAQQIEMHVSIQYERLIAFDKEEAEGIWQTISRPLDYPINIPLTGDAVDIIQKHENPYSRYAGGKAMGPTDEKMFFGRERVIDDIFHDIMREDEKTVDAGQMTAFYGQKRSGKTSIMNFLKAKIEKANPKVIVLTINAQDFPLEDDKPLLFMQKMLAAIFADLKKVLLNKRFKELRDDMKSIPLEIPNPKEFVVNPSAEITFLDFFGEFNTRFGEEYPIVLMIDEFTQVYVNLKRNMIHKGFLNQLRALVTDAGFANVFVGQDFMPKFFEDPMIAQGVNGLATTSMHGIDYLEKDDAYKMMEEPIRRHDDGSRFQGKLGEKAKKRIFDLTGGSAFYLMKFMNGLVGYMIENHNDLITPSLIEKVLDEYSFVTRDNPIEKKDFDPIFNEYSSSLVLREKPKAADTLRGQEETAKSIYRFFKEIARCVVEHGNENGVCHVDDIQWEDERERNDIIRTLRDRRILVDKEGNDIVGKELKGLEFKVKVGLFIEFLKREVLN